MRNKNLQRAVEEQTEKLLENISNNWSETISRDEELFFENQAILIQYDKKKADEYSQEYNKIITGRA